MKALGIIALVIAAIAIFVPVGSLYLTWFAFLLAAIAATSKEGTVYAFLTPLLGVLNIVLLSPVALGLILTTPSIMTITIMMAVAPIALVFLRGAFSGYKSSSVRVVRS